MRKPVGSVVLALAVAASGGTRADRLDEMQRPWERPVEQLSLDEYKGIVRRMATEHPETVTLTEPGRTLLGLPIYLLACTDKSVADDDKNIILVTTLHAGHERSGTAGVLAFADWLLGPDPLAWESLKKNIVLLMPNCHPEATYVTGWDYNSAGVNAYSGNRKTETATSEPVDFMDRETLMPREPEKAPEIMTFYRVSDEWKPDFHVDVHGTAQLFNGQILMQSVGRAGSNCNLKPWDDRIDLAMVQAGAAKGLGAVRYSAEEERLTWNRGEMPRSLLSRCSYATPRMYVGNYGYLRNHTMGTIIEASWVESVVNPMKGLLSIANRGFSEGPVKDFRVNRLRGIWETTYISSGGRTKAERRDSRVKIWRNEHRFVYGRSYPNPSNWGLAAVAYGGEAWKKLSSASQEDWYGTHVAFTNLPAVLASFPYVDRKGLERFLSVRPQPCTDLLFSLSENFEPDEPTPVLDAPVSILYTLPVANADILHVSANGRVLSESDTDGYQVWSEDGLTRLRVNITKERFAAEPLQLVGVAWNPPKGVNLHCGYKSTLEADASKEAIQAGDRLQVLWDDAIVDRSATTAERILHQPQYVGKVFPQGEPWEGDGCNWHNIFPDGDVLRMYYTAWKHADPETLRNCYAESRDGGETWIKPDLGLFEVNGSKHNNVILDKGCELFVFKDENPACPPAERYKGIGPVEKDKVRTLWCWTSPDPYHFKLGWKLAEARPTDPVSGFDTLNTVYWDAAKGEYHCYIRGFSLAADGDWVRVVRRIVSRDFHAWTPAEDLVYRDPETGAVLEAYPLYSNMVRPYPRNPELLVGFPSRYVERKEWTANFDRLPHPEVRKAHMKVSPRYGLSVTDGVFMFSRDGLNFSRDDDAWKRPGPERFENWIYGDGYPACGIVPTKGREGDADELSFFFWSGGWMGGASDLMRYTLRMDGFVSRHGRYSGAKVVTKPLVFAGSKMLVNFSTSARGRMFIEICDAEGKKLRSIELFGDQVDRPVDFEGGADVSAFVGRPMTVTFELFDADVYSFRFTE